jgi:hypothetical protein
LACATCGDVSLGLRGVRWRRQVTVAEDQVVRLARLARRS